MIEVFGDGSILFNAEHPVWMAERFRRNELKVKVTK